MERKIGIVVFTHGSRRRQANESLIEFVVRLRETVGCERIEPAFMEWGRPLLPAALRRLLARGCNHIYGCALFLVAGSHLQEDIPFIFEQTLKKHPGVTWEISPPMVEDARFLEYVSGKIRGVFAGGGGLQKRLYRGLEL